jgi:hypothetical protein
MVGTPSYVVWLAALELAAVACGFPRPPDVGQCTTASDCRSTGAPFCVAGSCVAACEANADCADLAATPFCQTSSGKCVACLDASVCSADKPVCDASLNVCRGCDRDEECAGGICVEADGTCVADGNVAFVDGLAGRDAGACTRTAPCLTLAFAIAQVPVSRDHIQLKILNGTFAVTASVSLIRSLYLEGSDTIVTGPAAMFTLAQGASVTLSHVDLRPASGLVTTVDADTTLRLFDVRTTGGFDVKGGSLDVDQTKFTNAGSVTCNAGTASVQRSVFDDSQLTTMTCAVIVRRTRFDLTSDANKITIDSGVLTFENNLMVQADGIADTMTVIGVAPGSALRFNTFVNTTVLASDGVALQCSPLLKVSSNIFAYNSMHPLASCDGARYSLLDSAALPQFAMGIGAKQGDRSTFFGDLPGKDFRLSASSPARGAAETGLGVSDDFDGNARPVPAGSPPDMGAFEAP